MNKLALLDLNGTIIKPVYDADDGWVVRPFIWEYVNRADSALSLLGAHGWMMAVCTNQPAEHRFDNIVHERMVYVMRTVKESLEEAASQEIPFFVCYHDDKHRCTCRKPEYGLLRSAVDHFGGLGPMSERDNWDVWMIGDTEKDTESGASFGVNTIRVGHIRTDDPVDYTYPGHPGIHKVRPTLLDAVTDILLPR